MKDLIIKGARVEKMAITDDELKLINKYAIEPLTSEQVFTFKVAICDNEIDREFEVFPIASLKKMASMFVGKTLIKDHGKQTDNQVARIYTAEVATGKGTTKNNEEYSQLIAYCYMVKMDSNKDLITEIQAGIKKEVSVSCAIKKAICSICGVDNRESYCKHYNGRDYDGKICYFKLLDPTDAYEVSFVAIPAQIKAGIIKSYTGEDAAEPLQTENLNKEKEDLIDTELGIIKSFIFTQKERG